MFRGLHPQVHLGTASDRYAGWLGQIYDRRRWGKQAAERRHVVGGKAYVERVLPVASVGEYFRHFELLEIDATFYRPLLDPRLKATETFHLLRAYADHVGEDDGLLLKAPQAVCAPTLLRRGKRVPNPEYLDAELFTHRFYAPALKLLGGRLAGIVFEQEYRRAAERDSVEREAADLDRFFGAVPADDRYHLELRTAAYLAEPVFEVLARRGVGHALSHWTWLPRLAEQHAKAGGRFLNAGGRVVIRLLTPRGMRYEDTYAQAFPFDRIVPGMLPAGMVEEAAAIMREAVDRGLHVAVVVNNRAGGNAPLIARKLADAFMGSALEK